MRLRTKKILLRHAYRQKKLSLVTGWKAFSLASGPIALLLVILLIVLSIFDNTLAAFVGGNFHELINEDPDAIYYEGDFESPEEMVEYGLKLAELVEAEGAALLLNENNALPLAAGSKVSCISSSSVNLVYGGTGSGNIDASSANTLKGALKNSGFVVNDLLWTFYSEVATEYLRPVGGTVTTEAATISECPWEYYPPSVIESIVEHGDAAIVVLSRVGGEGADLTFQSSNYLALDDNERSVLAGLKEMKDAGSVKKVIVLINSANPLQVDFLKNNEYDVDACLWIGDVGISGIDAVAEILAGNVVPSGSLVDTYCYDNYSSPAMQNFVPTTYEGYKEGLIPENASTYMIYQEGIYVGYKYYETRYEDYVMGTGNAGDYVYGDVVAFPFGYGLSYTDFEYSDMQVVYDKDTDQFQITLKVTNTGKEYSGKETVQIYVQSPYTEYDKEHGVEKASVSLCGFGKTEILAPGQSEILTINVDKRELASFDTYGAGTYILDAGEYYFTAATDAHNAINNILAAKGYDAANTANRMDGEGNAALVYNYSNGKFDDTTYATSLNGTAITNQLSDADINLYDGVNEEITYLSRNDWTGTWPTEILKIQLTEQLIAALQDVQYNAADYESVAMPVMGANNGLKLVDMIGKDFDDPAWQDLLDQMTFEEMVSLIGDAFHWTMPIESIHAPATRDENGPQGLTASLFSGGVKLKATAFTSEDVMAATFNTDLMTEIGKVMGNNCLEAGVSCLYGPGNNTHRTPYGGRNFEYYSEDAFLAAEMSKYQIAAMADTGVFVVMKHFALNDSEQDRIGLGVWINEQAAREIYLKAFQAPIEEANAGVMTAYTRWGAIWSGGHKGLMTNILREEWGKVGLNITDNVLTTYVNGVDGLMAGGVTAYDAMLWYVTKQLPKYENDPVIVNAMREACHHNLYSIANSNAMNGMGADTTIEIVELKVLSRLKIGIIIFSVLFTFATVMWVLGSRKFKVTQEYKDYKEFKAELKAKKKAERKSAK